MQTKFFTLDIVGYCQLEGTPFSDTNHFEITNPPCDCRIFHPHKHGAHIEFYGKDGIVTLTTHTAQCKVEFDGKTRTWNDYDVLKVQKYLWTILGKYGSPGAEVIQPTTEPPNWMRAKSQSALSFARKVFKR